MAPSPSRRLTTFGAFRRPVVTDPVFWLAAAMALAFGLVVGAVVVALLGVPGSWVGWLPAVVAAALFGWLGFKLLAMGLNMSRALAEPEVGDARRAARLEGTGRAAGALAGRGAAALARRGRASSDEAPPTPSAPAAPTPAPRAAATTAPPAQAAPAGAAPASTAPAPSAAPPAAPATASPSTGGVGPTTPTTPGSPTPPVPDVPGPDVPTPGPTPQPRVDPVPPEPARAHEEPAPDITVDKAARVIGSMIGRRVGDRRRGG